MYRTKRSKVNANGCSFYGAEVNITHTHKDTQKQLGGAKMKTFE